MKVQTDSRANLLPCVFNEGKHWSYNRWGAGTRPPKTGKVSLQLPTNAHRVVGKNTVTAEITLFLYVKAHHTYSYIHYVCVRMWDLLGRDYLNRFLFKHADFQSCLICVARRVPVKERPVMPTYESFTTWQDLQGRLYSKVHWFHAINVD